MLVLPQKVEMKWSQNIKKYYENKGYIWTKKGDLFKVNVLDLPFYSNKVVKVICDYCNEIFECKYNNHNRIRKIQKDCCINCSHLKTSDNYKEIIKNTLFPKIIHAFNERNYLLLSKYKDYKNNMTKLNYICLKHHDKGVLNITWADFQMGKGCKYCGFESISKIKTLDYKFIKEQFEKRGYTLLETNYINAKTPMQYICPKHPNDIQTIMYTNLIKGHGCKNCAIDAMSGENHPFWKGGISNTESYLRHNLIEWKKDSLRESEYKCVITGDKFDNIHHLYSFNLIIEEVLEENNIKLHKQINEYSDEELELLIEKVLIHHYDYPLGVCLREDVHKLFHSIYGYGNNTPEQFYEFKDNYLNGRL
jgi:hypothetical protein